MSVECWQDTSNDYKTLFETEEGYDTIIYVGENEKEFKVHSIILRIRSKYFRTAFSSEWAETNDDGLIILKKPNINPTVFKIILRFIYCGNVDLTTLQGPDVLKLTIASDELNLQQLIPYVQQYSNEHIINFLKTNPVEILEAIFQKELFTDLWNLCLEKICAEPEMLFNADKFVKLKAEILEVFLKRNNLGLDEILIWESLLKWSVAQNSTISQDVTKWSKEEISIMKETIQRFIPLIGFYHFTSEIFFRKVFPYKKLLPKKLVYNILEYHMIPGKELSDIDKPLRRSKLLKYDSVIVETQNFALFSSWIDKKDELYYNTKNIPYNFNLLYRASKDGFDTISFHSKCDNKGATIVIAKMKGSDRIFGGYNPLVWDDSGIYKATYNSFVFSFTNKQDLGTAIISRVNKSSYMHAIYCYSGYGPAFGGGHDLYYSGSQTWYFNNPYSYPSVHLPHIGNTGTSYKNLLADEYEVFQVIRK